MTTFRDEIQFVADAMLPPPAQDSLYLQTYVSRAQAATQVLALPANLGTGTLYERALYFRNVVTARMRDVSAMYRRAASLGVFVSSDPTLAIESLNYGRAVTTTIKDSPAHIETIKSLKLLCNLVNMDASGAIPSDLRPRPQASSVTISFESLPGLPSEVVNPDDLKRQQALAKLANVDFSKRKARMLFIAEDDRGSSVDLIIGWKKIRDASGYRVRVKDAVIGDEQTYTVKSADADNPDVETMSFYREMLAPSLGTMYRERDVALLRVQNVRRDSLFAAAVTPYQQVSTSRNDLFHTTVNRLTMTDNQLQSIASLIMSHVMEENTDVITPYPFLSEVLYGTRAYGWVLSGLNLLAAYERGETLDQVRRYSYIGAKFSDMRDQILSGRMYAPADKSLFVSSLDSSFSLHGLTNTLVEILEKCGMFMFFDEREGFDSGPSSLGREAANRETSIVSVVLSAIDTEVAMVKPSTVRQAILTARPPPPVASGFLILATTLGIRPLDSSDEPIDLLTFEGISRMLDVIVDSSRGA